MLVKYAFMSPILDKSSKVPKGDVKYIREGDTVAFGENSNEDHSSLSIKYDIGELVTKRGRNFLKVLVDGSGFMRSDGESIVLSGSSTNCIPRKPSEESKREDAEVIGRITGKEVVY
jgi:hypothetical protein